MIVKWESKIETNVTKKDVTKAYLNILKRDESKRVFTSPNQFAEFYSRNYLIEQNANVLSDIPNSFYEPNRDSGEDIVCMLQTHPFLKVIEVKGNGSEFTVNRLNSLVKSSIQKSFGANTTKVNSVFKLTLDTRASVDQIMHISTYVNQVNKGRLDAIYTETHAYTASNTPTKGTVKRESEPKIFGIHFVRVFNTAKFGKEA